MRKVIVLLVVLLLATFVYGQQECGDGSLDPGEECDPGSPELYPANDSACPELCQWDCTCAKESSFVLFDLAMGHNLLFSKVQDLLHVIKDMLFQLEMKTIEIQLTDFNCSQQPVSFWIPAQYDPYGKLNEIDSLVKLTIQSLNKSIQDGGIFGSIDLTNADALLQKSEACIANSFYRDAFNCKCLAYRVYLLNLSDDLELCGENVPCAPQ